jgi:hypothetical protein
MSQYRANLLRESVTTMNDLKNCIKRLYYFSMFDGGLELKNNNTARLRIVQTEDKKEYLEYVGKTLNSLNIGFSINPKNNASGFKNSKPQLILSTSQHPKLFQIRNRIYLNGRKVLDPHMIRFLDEEAFTILFMADGSSSYAAKGSPQYYVHTNMLSYPENCYLQIAIRERLGIDFNVVQNKGLWELRMRASSLGRMLEVIEPHILECYAYKFKTQ